MLFKHLPGWLCKKMIKSRARCIALFSCCTLTMFIGLYISSSIVSINVVWPDFQLHLPFVEPALGPRDTRFGNPLFLAVVLNSAASGQKHRVLRKAIRTTWGNSSNLDYKNKTWKVFFVLGISENETEHELNLHEATHSNDIIIGNFTDHYKNVILKTFMSHYWVTSKFPSCKYVLKTDDDVYVRVPMLLQWLERVGWPRSFYGGHVGKDQRTVRDPKSKWFLTREQYEEKYLPPFCHGAFHVLSTDILPQFYNYTKYRRKPFHTDDAYIGVVARDLEVKAVDIPGFNLRFKVKPRSDCHLITSIAMGHKITASKIEEYYKFYTEKMKAKQYTCLASNLQHLSISIFVCCHFAREIFMALLA